MCLCAKQADGLVLDVCMCVRRVHELGVDDYEDLESKRLSMECVSQGKRNLTCSSLTLRRLMPSTGLG